MKQKKDIKKLVRGNVPTFFDNVEVDEIFNYAEDFSPQSVHKLSLEKNVIVAYCPPGTREYKLYGAHTMKVLKSAKEAKIAVKKNVNMKNFEVDISLRKFFELGGELKPGQLLKCIEHYPCKFISQKNKFVKRNAEDRDNSRIKGIKMVHYKIEFMDASLYSKGKIAECFESELSVTLTVKPIL